MTIDDHHHPHDRDFCIHYARVLLREAHARRDNPAQRAWCFWLLDCAGRARRRAMSMGRPQRSLIA